MASSLAVGDQLVQRVCAEFLEMPGLHLSCRQAQRLWGLDERTCRGLLEYLVEQRFLSCDHDCYSRLTEGPVTLPYHRHTVRT
jgi:hypothetical protein